MYVFTTRSSRGDPKGLLSLARSVVAADRVGSDRAAQFDLWSSYEGQTVDALAVGGDEGRG